MTTKLTWVLAHEPYDLFLRAAEKFSQEVNQKTNGAFEIEILGIQEYAEKHNNGVAVDNRTGLLDLLENGSIQLSQMYTTTLGQRSQDMFVLDLPFLFEGHDHAARVLDGEIGQQLFDTLSKESKIQGLAFTYSGGFRIVPSAEPIGKLEDLAGMRVRVPASPVAHDTFEAIGAIPVEMPIEALSQGLAEKLVDAGESTYPRIYSMNQAQHSKSIAHTEHSLFLTSLIMNKDLWDSFDTETQQIFNQAALSAAQVERQESIQDIAKTQARAESDGITVTRLSDSDTAKFKAATADLHDKYDDIFTKGLIGRIKTA
jgi:TRAP-type C4-dicarboxylate transport system substrate-binding protein